MYREIFVFAFVLFFFVASTGVVLNGVSGCHTRGRGLAGGRAFAQRPRHEGALAHAWNHVSGALARFASGRGYAKKTTAGFAKTTCKPVLKRAGEGPENPLAAVDRRYSFGSFPAARRRRARSFRLAPPKLPKSEGATRPEASKSC